MGVQSCQCLNVCAGALHVLSLSACLCTVSNNSSNETLEWKTVYLISNAHVQNTILRDNIIVCSEFRLCYGGVSFYVQYRQCLS